MSHPSSFAKRETLSPGLLFSNGDRTPAFELKFLLCEARAHEVERWAATHFVPDPHADPDLVTAYRVTSLYLDTPGLDVFHRFPPHHRRKLRLRGYGSWATVFLEQKTRHGDRVRKRRTPILQSELHRFRDAAHRRRLATDGRAEPLPNRYPQRDMSEANGEDWPGDWFHHRLLERGLRPTFQIGCVRSAFLGAGPEGPMRLTLDRHIRGVPNEEWRLVATQGGLRVLDGQVVLELKYRNALPAPFKRLLERTALHPCPVSKYRLAVRAWNPDGNSR